MLKFFFVVDVQILGMYEVGVCVMDLCLGDVCMVVLYVMDLCV